MIGSGVPWMRKVAVAVAAIVAVLAIVGYFIVIPSDHTQRSRLAKLVVTTPPAGFTAKPSGSGEMAATANPFAAAKAAAKKSPNSTGSYSIAWNGTTAANSLSLLVTMLPSTAEATTVLSQATTTYLQANSFTKEKFSLLHQFSVATPAGTTAATYTSSAAQTAVVAYRSGGVVVVIFAEETKAAPAEQAATALAASESDQLQKIGSAVVLHWTTWPLVASLVYFVVALALVALIVGVPFFGVPLFAERARRLQRERRERERRRAFHSSGSKIAKRQASRRR